jgi:hypothetical protein
MEKETGVLCIEGVAIDGGPESCVGVPVRAQRSVDRGRVGGAIEPRNLIEVRGADVLPIDGRQHRQRRFRELLVDPARSEIPGTHADLHAREPGDPAVARGADRCLVLRVRGVVERCLVGREGNAEAVIP